MIRAPIQMLTGVLNFHWVRSEYRIRKRSSSIAGKISSAKIFAHEFSRAFCSRKVREFVISVRDSCCELFIRNAIETPPF